MERYIRNNALWVLWGCIHEDDCAGRKEKQTGVERNWHKPHGTSLGKCLQCLLLSVAFRGRLGANWRNRSDGRLVWAVLTWFMRVCGPPVNYRIKALEFFVHWLNLDCVSFRFLSVCAYKLKMLSTPFFAFVIIRLLMWRFCYQAIGRNHAHYKWISV